jgi:hypothetical protein
MVYISVYLRKLHFFAIVVFALYKIHLILMHLLHNNSAKQTVFLMQYIRNFANAGKMIPFLLLSDQEHKHSPRE